MSMGIRITVRVIHAERKSGCCVGDNTRSIVTCMFSGQLLYRCLLSGSGCVDALSRLAGAIRWHIAKLHIDRSAWRVYI